MIFALVCDNNFHAVSVSVSMETPSIMPVPGVRPWLVKPTVDWLASSMILLFS